MELAQLNDRDKFIVARWAYSLGSPVMSDAEYTILLHTMEALYPDDEYVNRSWSSDPCPTELLKSIGRNDLIYKVVLMDKTESIPSLNSELELQQTLGSISGRGTLSMKHDGWNVQVNYYNGRVVNISTRGRSSDAMDVSGLCEYVPEEIPCNNVCKVVGELTVSKANFQFCARMFNNVSERAAVSTILSRPEYYHLLTFTAFDVHGYELNGKCKFELLQDWGFNTPMYEEVSDFEDLVCKMNILSNAKDAYQHPTDGLVYDGVMRRAIRLLAWEEPIYTSFVSGYLEKFGPYRISPSVLIHPVLRGGTTQRQVSMTNWQRILDYNLQKGAPIAFRVASSATADFDEESTRLLHKQWEGNWEEFQRNVIANEEMNRCQRQMYVNGLL